MVEVDTLVNPSIAWYGQMVLAVLVLFLLTAAVARAWDSIHGPWRWVLRGVIAEHAVLAYGSWEARQADVGVELRVFLLTMTLVGVLIACAIVLVDDYHNGPTFGRR